MIRILAVIIGVSLLAGCATTEAVVPISYTAAAAEPVQGAGAVKLVVNDGRTIDRKRISTKINSYGVNMGVIRSETDVSDVVRDALKAELEQRGFRIDASGRVMTAEIQRFYNEYESGAFAGTAKGDVELTVTVTEASGAPLFSHPYKGSSEEAVFIANGSNAAESVAKALKDAIDKMFADPEFRQSLTGSGRRVGQRAE
jgi:uncharacterized lipoprotein YajG